MRHCPKCNREIFTGERIREDFVMDLFNKQAHETERTHKAVTATFWGVYNGTVHPTSLSVHHARC